MSIPVDLARLAETLARYRFAYLLTASERGAPHAVAVNAVLQDGALVVDETGRRTRDNAVQRPEVALVWPPQSESDYSLIVDGRAVEEGGGLRIVPSRAVLHRPTLPRTPALPGACGSDCGDRSPTQSCGAVACIRTRSRSRAGSRVPRRFAGS